MKNEIEKLSSFKEAVFADMDRQTEKILAQADKESAENKKQAEQEIQADYQAAISETDKTEEEAAVREISAVTVASKRELLEYREEITDKVFTAVLEQVEGFTKTDEYALLMVERAKKCAEENKNLKGKIFVRHRDMALAEKLSACGDFTVEEKDTILYGGIMVVYESTGLAYDYTADSVLEEERRAFAGRAGLNL